MRPLCSRTIALQQVDTGHEAVAIHEAVRYGIKVLPKATALGCGVTCGQIHTGIF